MQTGQVFPIFHCSSEHLITFKDPNCAEILASCNPISPLCFPYPVPHLGLIMRTHITFGMGWHCRGFSIRKIRLIKHLQAIRKFQRFLRWMSLHVWAAPLSSASSIGRRQANCNAKWKPKDAFRPIFSARLPFSTSCRDTRSRGKSPARMKTKWKLSESCWKWHSALTNNFISCLRFFAKGYPPSSFRLWFPFIPLCLRDQFHLIFERLLGDMRLCSHESIKGTSYGLSLSSVTGVFCTGRHKSDPSQWTRKQLLSQDARNILFRCC